MGLIADAMQRQGLGAPVMPAPAAPAPGGGAPQTGASGLPPATPAFQRMVLAFSRILANKQTAAHVLTWLKTHPDKAQAAGHMALMIMREMIQAHATGHPPPGDTIRALIAGVQMVLEIGAAAGVLEDTPEIRVQALHDARTESAAYAAANPKPVLRNAPPGSPYGPPAAAMPAPGMVQ